MLMTLVIVSFRDRYRTSYDTIVPDTYTRGHIHALSFVSYVTPGCVAIRHMALEYQTFPCHSKPKDTTVVDSKRYRPLVPRDYVYSRSSGAPTRSVGGRPLL